MEDTQENKNDRKKDYEYLKEIFDKQIELEKMRQKKTPAWKIITLIFTGIASIAFLAFTCFMLYKQSFTMETLLAVLLSFFSIGLSIMFYIQSEKSSSAYYMRSYEIMKDVSVALGKIEASFGEKLSNINSSLGKIERSKQEVEKEIEQKEQEQKEIRKEITTNTKLTQSQKEDLLNKLQQASEENTMLKRKLDRLEVMHSHDMQRRIEMEQKFIAQNHMINKLNNNIDLRNRYINIRNENDE